VIAGAPPRRDDLAPLTQRTDPWRRLPHKARSPKVRIATVRAGDRAHRP